MSAGPSRAAPFDDPPPASGTSATPSPSAAAPSNRVRTVVRWSAVLSSGVAVIALLALELLERPGHEVVILSVGVVHWRPILHLLFLACMCIAVGTVARQLATGVGRLQRFAAGVLGSLAMVSACGLVIGMALFAVVASARQYVTITADDGERFLVRAITLHHTDYTILEPAGGVWYSDGASILTNDPNSALATGDYVLQRTPTGYHLAFSQTPGRGTWYELDW